MCYEKKRWNDAADAITKSSMVLPMYCLKNEDGTTPEDWASQSEMFEVAPRPKKITLPSGEVVFVEKEKLDYKFDLNQEIECHA